MYAYFVPGSHYRARFLQQSVLGMPLLRAELPLHSTSRKQRRIAKKLTGLGVHRLLSAPQDFDFALLPPLNETRFLWKLHAAAVALALLEQNQHAPHRSIVELVDSRFTPGLQPLAQELLPLVGHLSFSMPVPEDFSWALQREFGVAPLSCPGHVSICFVPAERKLALPLWMERPAVPGLTLSLPGLPTPNGCPELPLLAALAQQGRIDPKQLQISPDST